MPGAGLCAQRDGAPLGDRPAERLVAWLTLSPTNFACVRNHRVPLISVRS
ncbi:hypothetical protein D187_001527 [Cystobacter fuscus DSM 2262]|uniref:Uncharacterized protein n=1 Tax=Cystobacter fuscus (strain ATCC 25194 / DSM 2262 / NBRC 100088 / M29) TaxID=1242864 RepID=S9PCP3_CYSF2|nr:hypothetical protein D187_001527 [Cystobacter fuscus DSM 2262]